VLGEVVLHVVGVELVDAVAALPVIHHKIQVLLLRAMAAAAASLAIPVVPPPPLGWRRHRDRTGQARKFIFCKKT
jgi:hypothetical protein